jgi:hypothetical protein
MALGPALDSADSAAMPEPPRRFPPPWHADPMPGGYVVRDANGRALADIALRDTFRVHGDQLTFCGIEALRGPTEETAR